MPIAEFACEAFISYSHADETWASRRDAEREAETSRRTADFIVQLFNVVDPGEARGRAASPRTRSSRKASSRFIS